MLGSWEGYGNFYEIWIWFEKASIEHKMVIWEHKYTQLYTHSIIHLTIWFYNENKNMWVKVGVCAHIPIQNAKWILTCSFEETFLLVVCISTVSLYYMGKSVFWQKRVLKI